MDTERFSSALSDAERPAKVGPCLRKIVEVFTDPTSPKDVRNVNAFAIEEAAVKGFSTDLASVVALRCPVSNCEAVCVVSDIFDPSKVQVRGGLAFIDRTRSLDDCIM